MERRGDALKQSNLRVCLHGNATSKAGVRRSAAWAEPTLTRQSHAAVSGGDNCLALRQNQRSRRGFDSHRPLHLSLSPVDLCSRRGIRAVLRFQSRDAPQLQSLTKTSASTPLACVETNLKARLGVRVLEDPGNLVHGSSHASERKS